MTHLSYYSVEDTKRINDFRDEHIKFHSDRVKLFMFAARQLKEYNAIIRGEFGRNSYDDAYNAELIQGMVKEARRENLIVRYWKRMSDSQIYNEVMVWSG
jgi:hypothetical protein